MIAVSESESQAVYESYVRSTVGAPSKLAAIASTIGDARFPGALIPLDANADRIVAAAATYLEWRRLAPLLEARIGDELSDFPGIVRHDSPQPVLADLLGGFAPALWCLIRLVPSARFREAAVMGCFRLVQNVLDHATLLEPPARQRGGAELLAAFDNAMAGMDLTAAQAALDELRAGNYLDGLNLRFLRLRILDARGPGASSDLATLSAELRGLPVPGNVGDVLKRVASD